MDVSSQVAQTARKCSFVHPKEQCITTCPWPKDNPSSCGQWPQFAKDPTARLDFCSPSPTQCWSNLVSTHCPRGARTRQTFSWAKLNMGQLVLNGNLTQDVLWLTISKAGWMSKGCPKTNPFQQETKREQCLMICPYKPFRGDRFLFHMHTETEELSQAAGYIYHSLAKSCITPTI